MRAHFIADLTKRENYSLKGDSLHHLVNVIRIEAGEELLLINGKGLFCETIVETISKKEIGLKLKSSTEKDRSYQFDLALGMPKRDALELCLKEATELGFRKIYLVRSDYSQMRYPDQERIEKILIAALEQSNAPFLPEVVESSWENILWTQYEEALLLDSQTKLQTKIKADESIISRLLIVGPEGGFSPRELNYLHAEKRVKVVNLPTPILRTPTALAAGTGIMIERLLK
jgi:16S rRNA (uracil1498-N3)-methyltransferase